jgi:uncharacterized protein (DUF1499 family)
MEAPRHPTVIVLVLFYKGLSYLAAETDPAAPFTLGSFYYAPFTMVISLLMPFAKLSWKAPLLKRLSAVALALSLVFATVPPASAVPLSVPLSPRPMAALPFLGTLFAGQRPNTLGVKNGQLSPCPGSPNCVVSQGNPDAEHAIDPIAYSGDPASALARLEALITEMPRTAIIEKNDTYLYAEFTSKLMGYVDDVEFYLDPANSVVHVRSASRLGESDLGVNRKRIEAIRDAFSA